MGDAQTQINYPKNIGFEQVWASLDRLTQKQEEIVRQQEETDRLLKEMIKENNKRFGDINNRFGDLVECMISPNILDKFRDFGLEFETAAPNVKVRDHKNKIYFEIDVFLQNTTAAMLVEIKTELKIEYINEHIKRLEKMRTFADLHNEKRTFFGAVLGIIISSDAKKYALENGLYLIEPLGEDLSITSPYNKPKEW
jgi:hypothetical protein